MTFPSMPRKIKEHLGPGGLGGRLCLTQATFSNAYQRSKEVSAKFTTPPSCTDLAALTQLRLAQTLREWERITQRLRDRERRENGRHTHRHIHTHKRTHTHTESYSRGIETHSPRQPLRLRGPALEENGPRVREQPRGTHADPSSRSRRAARLLGRLTPNNTVRDGLRLGSRAASPVSAWGFIIMVGPLRLLASGDVPFDPGRGEALASEPGHPSNATEGSCSAKPGGLVSKTTVGTTVTGETARASRMRIG